MLKYYNLRSKQRTRCKNGLENSRDQPAKTKTKNETESIKTKTKTSNIEAKTRPRPQKSVSSALETKTAVSRTTSLVKIMSCKHVGNF